jgi:hypothetical protein
MVLLTNETRALSGIGNTTIQGMPCTLVTDSTYLLCHDIFVLLSLYTGLNSQSPCQPCRFNNQHFVRFPFWTKPMMHLSYMPPVWLLWFPMIKMGYFCTRYNDESQRPYFCSFLPCNYWLCRCPNRHDWALIAFPHWHPRRSWTVTVPTPRK